MLGYDDGFKDASTSLDPTIADETNVDYMKGYRAGLVALKAELEERIVAFDRDFPVSPAKFLSEKTREELVEQCVQSRCESMFGDGQEEEYARGGISVDGVVDLSDLELMDEYKDSCWDTDMEDDENEDANTDELLTRAQAEYAAWLAKQVVE